MGRRVVSEVTQSDLIAWLCEAQNENEWEDASRNRYHAALSTIYRIAMTDKKLPSNPASCIPKLQENNDQVRFLTLDEEKSLMKARERDSLSTFQSWCWRSIPARGDRHSSAHVWATTTPTLA